MKQAVGLIEVIGLASAIDVADVMVKAANVQLVGIEKARGSGWMTVKVIGDVGAVKASAEAGQARAVANQSFVSTVVIPRPANGLEKTFKLEKVSENTKKTLVTEKQEEVKPEPEKVTDSTESQKAQPAPEVEPEQVVTVAEKATVTQPEESEEVKATAEPVAEKVEPEVSVEDKKTEEIVQEIVNEANQKTTEPQVKKKAPAKKSKKKGKK